MKKLRLFSFVILFLIIITTSNSVYAIDISGFILEDRTEEQNIGTWENINIHKIENINLDQFFNNIVNFDVSDNSILIVFEDEKLCVLDKDGTVKKFFDFDLYGSYSAYFNGKNIQLFDNRSSLIIEFDLNGNMVSINSIDESVPENFFIWDDLITYNIQTQIVNANSTYFLEAEKGTVAKLVGYYTKLYRVDENGNETVLYDVGKNAKQKTIIIIVFFVIFELGVFFAIFGTLIKIRIRKRRENKQEK